MPLPKSTSWIVIGLLLAWGGLLWWSPWHSTPPIAPIRVAPEVVSSSIPPSNLVNSEIADLPEGEALARKVCITCHLFPSPELLDRTTWKDGTLPWMASWLGMAPPPAERLADGTLVDDASLYPSGPLLSSNEWRSIMDFYLTRSPAQLTSPGPRLPVRADLRQFAVQAFPYQRRVPMTALVKIDPQTQTLYVGDAMTRTLEAVRVGGENVFTMEFDSSPICLRVQPGRVDVTLVGRLFPSDQLKGKQVILVPGADTMGVATMIGPLRRPTDAVFADLNGDGKEDVIISQFGHLRGRLSWFEKTTGAEFEEHILADRPGTICAKVHDFTGDGRPDILAVLSQAWEGVTLWVNAGDAPFEERRLVEQSSVFGYSGLEIVDFDGDGDMDFLTVNGDNGEYQAPAKPYHGIRLYLNDGHAQFRESWFYEFPGAYHVMARDFDRDGDMDLAAISFYPDYDRGPGASFVYLENLGALQFQAWTFPEADQGRWMTMDAGDLDGDGDEDIVLGSLVMGPTTIPIPRAVQEGWKSGGRAVLWLRNLSR